MAAGLGFKTFTTGEVLTAADTNGYLMQGINVFATEAARNAAITAPAEGQFAFTKDTNSLWYYDGAAWVASGATGDIEGVTAGIGISGGGTSGTVTVTNSMATAIDAKGDLVAGTGADAFSRLAVGANDTVLTADSAQATGLKWAAAAGAPGLAFVTSATFTSATTVSINSCFSGTYDNYLVTLNTTTGTAADYKIKLRLSGTDSSASYKYNTLTTSGATVSSATLSAQTTGFPINASDQSSLSQVDFQFLSPAVAVKTWYKASSFYSGSGGTGVTMTNGIHEVSTAYDGVTISWTNSATGTVRVYGLRNS